MGKRAIKYNPAFLSGDELVQDFVVRIGDYEMIMEVVKENVTDSNQHMMVIGPRGIGKTMLALRVVEGVRRDDELVGLWYPIVFGEESYQVSTTGEFWLEALFHLSHQTDDMRWKRSYEELLKERNDDRLREQALGQLMDFADEQGKRILLVVENFNMLLGGQIDDDDAWKLRHTLLNEKRVMVLATATSRFDEIDNSEKAMFDLFRGHELKPLDENECRALWKSMTGEELKGERIRPVKILTGGSPRLLRIISTFAAGMSIKELMDDLVRLVDEHTEYFKSHLDALAPIERKVYLGLAELWTQSTAREVGRVARLEVSKTSSFLGRLKEKGMVIEISGKGKKKLYQVAERMYNIYYLMRRRGTPAARVKAVVHFMVSFYQPEELVQVARLIGKEACELGVEMCKDHLLFYEGILTNSVTKPYRERLLEAVPDKFREKVGISIPGEELEEKEGKQVADEVRKLIKEANELSEQKDKLEEAVKLYRKVVEMEPELVSAWHGLGLAMGDLGRYEEAESAFRKAVELKEDDASAWNNLGVTLGYLGRYEEAKNASHKAVELKKDDALAWYNLGVALFGLDRYEEAEKASRKAVELEPKLASAWHNLGMALGNLGRHEEAESALRKVVEFEPELALAWNNLGVASLKLFRYEEAESAFSKAVKLKGDYVLAWYNLGVALGGLGRNEEAENAFRKAVELEPERAPAWNNLGAILGDLGRHEEAESAFRKAVELEPELASAWSNLGAALCYFGRHKEAEDASRKAVELKEDYALAWYNLGTALGGLGRHEEAERALRKAIELEPKLALAWNNLGMALGSLGRNEEAENAFRKAVELKPNDGMNWVHLVRLLIGKLGRTKEGLELTEKYFVEQGRDSGSLNGFAWVLFEQGSEKLLAKAEVWAREAVAEEPGNGYCQHTLGSILCALGKEDEALEHAQKYLEDRESVEKTVDEAIGLFVELAARGFGREAVEVLQGSASEEILEPLIVGLQMYIGDEVKAAVEIMEVGKDVAKRIEKRRKEIEAG